MRYSAEVNIAKLRVAFVLAFHPVLRKAEFVEKDSDYGDGVLSELAKVL